MIADWVVILFALGYLTLLFTIAYVAEKRSLFTDSIASNPYIYSLSIAVYCTAWTFYGSIGRASQDGIQFLAVYIGPTLFAPVWFFLLRKIIRICKVQHITNISDFIASRYGKNIYIGAIATIFCLIGIIPYISLQLKAISESFSILSTESIAGAGYPASFIYDKAFYLAVALSVFIILFGTRKAEATEQHRGMVVAIAFESMVKLIAFLTAGIFITYGVFNGFGDIFSRIQTLPNADHLFVISEKNGYAEWLSVSLLSGIAAVFLPRQFQVGVIENVDETHIEKSIWVFPLYIFAINIFVLPIAFAGKLLYASTQVNADYYILSIPISHAQRWLSMLVYIGGFSAATSMIIVECIALSTMISNNLVLPFFIRNNFLQSRQINYINTITLYSRRISIVLIMLSAFWYYQSVSQIFSLVSIGLISFVSVAQFVPAIIGGIFWKRANTKAAMTGILVGFFMWFYTLVLPSLAGTSSMIQSIITHGPFDITWLRPYELFNLRGFSPVTNAFFWSMAFNLLCFILISVWTERSSVEKNQAEIFVDIFKYSELYENSIVWKGTAYLADLQRLLESFIGVTRAEQLLRGFANRYKIDWQTTSSIDARLVSYTERILSGYVGSASARLMIAATTKEEELKIEGLMDVLKESQQLINLNKELLRKTNELKKPKSNWKMPIQA